jgi:hypothetical protein
MSIDQPNDVPEDDADETQSPIPDAGPMEFDGAPGDEMPSEISPDSASADRKEADPAADGPATPPSDIAVDSSLPIGSSEGAAPVAA